MMSVKFKIVAFFILSAIALKAQVVLNLHVITSNKNPIRDAIITYNTLVQNSNGSGFLRISKYTYGDKITIKKLGFMDTILVLNSTDARDTLTITIALQSKIMLLDEVPVYSNKVQEINPKKSDFILDYELYGEGIVQLLSNNNILLLNAENSITCNKKIYSGAASVVKDFYGHVHLTTSSSAYQASIDGNNLSIDTIPIKLENFNWAIIYCDGVLDTLNFIRRYKDINQTVAFFAISTVNNKRFILLKEISDGDKKKAVKANAKKVNGLIKGLYDPINTDGNFGGEMGLIGWQELEMRRNVERLTYEQKTLYDKPSYNTLKLMNDSIYIFAHDIDTLFVYDKACHLTRSTYIDYHHLKSWGSEIITNEEKTKVYGKFVSNKNIMIAEINLNTGQLKLPFFKIESSSSPRKIRIRGGILYYLAKQPDGSGYTVYAQDLQL